MKSPKIILSFCLLFVFVGCQKTSFHGANKGRGNEVPTKDPLDLSKEYQNKHPDENVAANPNAPLPGLGVNPSTGVIPGNGSTPFNIMHTFDVPCNAPSVTRVPFADSENFRYQAVVRGQICPESAENMHLVFIVDFSGSMGPHIDPKTKAESPGSDPLDSQGTCGRLSAASQLISYVQDQQKAQNGNVIVSVVPFANIAINRMIIENVDIDTFAKKYLDKQYFCRYVAQDGHELKGQSLDWRDLGLLSRQDLTPDTNYAAAFSETQALLHRSAVKNPIANNNTQVFFISDGQPTIPNNEADGIKAGREAGVALRNDETIKHLTINGLYNGIKGSPAYSAAAGVLKEVTGSVDRVFAVENAKDLAKMILNFPHAQINLDATKYPEMATLRVDPDPVPYGTMPLGIQYLREVGNGVWEYQTQPFLLLGRKGKTFDNQVYLNIFSPDGFRFNSLVHIDYTQR